MTLSAGAQEFVLAFADDEHLIGQRHTEWIGIAPFLEEDLAITSIAQDELGHAAGLYDVLTDDTDRLAFLREPADYRSCWLVEQPGTEWAHALVRHWLYDRAERLRWEAVAGSTHRPLADLTGHALREEAYHRRHADAMVDRLLGDEESRGRMTAALDDYLPLAVALFEAVAGEAEALADSVVARSSADLCVDWWTEVSEQLTRLGVDRVQPDVAPDLQAGRTIRTDHFATLHAEIIEVLLIEPDGEW